MATFEVPATVHIKAKSAAEASELVLAFLEYAQDVGNDDGAVIRSLVGTEKEVKRLPARKA